MLGYSESELLQLSYLDITPESWHEYEKRIIKNHVIPKGYSGVYEKEYRKKDGTIFPAELRISLIRDEIGNPDGMWAVVRDITERKYTEQELERMVDRFNLATRSGDMGVWEWVVITDQLDWDDRMFELYGVDRENFSGNLRAWEDALHPDDREQVKEEIQLALKGIKEFDCEYRVIHADGSIHYIKAYAQVVRDSGGNPLRFTGINFDITLQEQTRESLQISEMFNRGLVESAPVGILFLDKTGVITFENQTMLEMMGTPEGSDSVVIGKPFQDLPSVKAVIKEFDFASILSGERINGRELHYSSIFGKELDLEIYTAPLQNNAGEVYGIILMAVDITKPNAAGKELRESEHKYRRLYESMRDGFIRLDMQKYILDYNSFFLTMTGYTSEDIANMRTIRAIVPEKWHTKVDEIVKNEVLVKGYSEVFEIEYRRQDSTIFPVELRLFLNQNQQGTGDGMWAIVRDITDRKKMEMELLGMNVILEHKVEEKTKELKERVQELERFYKATIDRELRMKEMRVRIEELESELKKNNP
jgi:PAS domain S-box-containing protein